MGPCLVNTVPYIPGLAPTYIPVLPTDPRPGPNAGCYGYASNGTDYMILVYNTVETYTLAGNPKKQPSQPSNLTFAAYTPGAITW